MKVNDIVRCTNTSLPSSVYFHLNLVSATYDDGTISVSGGYKPYAASSFQVVDLDKPFGQLDAEVQKFIVGQYINGKTILVSTPACIGWSGWEEKHSFNDSDRLCFHNDRKYRFEFPEFEEAQNELIVIDKQIEELQNKRQKLLQVKRN